MSERIYKKGGERDSAIASCTCASTTRTLRTLLKRVAVLCSVTTYMLPWYALPFPATFTLNTIAAERALASNATTRAAICVLDRQISNRRRRFSTGNARGHINNTMIIIIIHTHKLCAQHQEFPHKQNRSTQALSTIIQHICMHALEC